MHLDDALTELVEHSGDRLLRGPLRLARHLSLMACTWLESLTATM